MYIVYIFIKELGTEENEEIIKNNLLKEAIAKKVTSI